jgi:hypothetical protein
MKLLSGLAETAWARLARYRIAFEGSAAAAAVRAARSVVQSTGGVPSGFQIA